LLKLLEQPLQPQQILFLTLLRLLSLAKTLTKLNVKKRNP
jgi:hypothetical protein